ncbi:hypothetical protein BV25DRAFT_1824155 [Artomyces pyxidatus]|uniref:Uncharacterized protein n=1 Tax=Artomyces pyxidatus TaxID=48021 RepID=A0ACB8T632_9AGAM|nr:hypothetical protein BV25DRAFT_1824155 [Artomyces pyxidatus]
MRLTGKVGSDEDTQALAFTLFYFRQTSTGSTVDDVEKLALLIEQVRLPGLPRQCVHFSVHLLLGSHARLNLILHDTLLPVSTCPNR